MTKTQENPYQINNGYEDTDLAIAYGYGITLNSINHFLWEHKQQAAIDRYDDIVEEDLLDEKLEAIDLDVSHDSVDCEDLIYIPGDYKTKDMPAYDQQLTKDVVALYGLVGDAELINSLHDFISEHADHVCCEVN